MERINEWGEKISEDELTTFANRIRKLSDTKIDKLLYLCRFIISDREKRFKAIRQYDIDIIRESLDSAKEKLWNFLIEIPLSDFKQNLSKVEK